MSLAQAPAQGQRVSPALNLGTNNPFRARLSGIVPNSPASPGPDPFASFAPQQQQRERPKSRNPFLDVFDDDTDFDHRNTQSRPAHRANSFDATSANSSGLTGSAAELFANLAISDHPGAPQANMSRPAPPAPPPPSNRRPPPPGHHKSRSGLDDGPLISVTSFDSRPAPPGSRRPPPPPHNRMPQTNGGDRSRQQLRPRPRRNSDSSVIDAHEIEARDRQRKDRDRRPRDGKLRADSAAKSSSRRDASSDRRKKHSALDVIDKLDVTGIYGSGLFHHDGPFDACNPHRNKSSRRLAPVQAFPAESANMSMSGFGPLNAKADHSHIFGHGRDGDAFNDFDSTRRPSAARATSFDPKSAVETLHGDESLGLGTSTFLDGAPASRKAMLEKANNEAFEERPRSSSDGGFGLQRKKSLAQKIRGIKPDAPGRRRAPPPPGPQRSPSGDSPTTPVGAESPFFNDYDDAYDRKGESISVVENGSRRSPTSPKKPHLNRIGTDDSSSNGLLKRVRSLSKPKRRNE